MKGNTVSNESLALQNRLQKNLKKLKTFIQKNGLEAYRLYNKDIPEYPYIIDIYQDKALIYEQGKKLGDEDEVKRIAHQSDIQKALIAIFSIPENKQFYKIREKQKGKEQYRPIVQNSSDFFVINEPPLKFYVNLERYLDTGLFLDHRPLRQFLTKNSSDKNVLNLFCYTGSLSAAAAIGGAHVTSVDMSNTYLDWAIDNFILNGIDPKDHVFFQADVTKDLRLRFENKEEYDLILLDPPSFSNSKRMEEDLDIDRDHPLLIRDSMNLLEPDGELIFSTNKRKFELHSIVSTQYQVKEISQWTIPQDFSGSHIHRAFSIKRK